MSVYIRHLVPWYRKRGAFSRGHLCAPRGAPTWVRCPGPRSASLMEVTPPSLPPGVVVQPTQPLVGRLSAGGACQHRVKRAPRHASSHAHRRTGDSLSRPEIRLFSRSRTQNPGKMNTLGTHHLASVARSRPPTHMTSAHHKLQVPHPPPSAKTPKSGTRDPDPTPNPMTMGHPWHTSAAPTPQTHATTKLIQRLHGSQCPAPNSQHKCTGHWPRCRLTVSYMHVSSL